ncbi:hypothetical protein C9374_011431 [Naegleria lovaniensis]|uniref:DUF952 domain-containing protein n=1 Tax=Naegleria lovaniensis TaxID=51637 RepID=A0AA88KQR9_NAELO|nr:uncharacterized protein C9374_011431 [Naegleria lovaniensis]KAG2392706.1 hypothetical protein C9374_011431 [Naegleria lovaniensis]
MSEQSLPPVPSPSFVYHLVSLKAFDDDVAQNDNEYFQGDTRDGFLHMSMKEEVEKTCRLYLSNVSDLILLKIDLKTLEQKLNSQLGERISFDWVQSRNNYFPHLYGKLSVDCIVDIIEIPRDEHGHHVFDNIQF